MSDFFEMLKVFFFGACLVAVILAVIYFCFSFFESSHVKTENEPTLHVHLEDISYKGHTYILLTAPYGKAIVHAEHCKCRTVK